MSAERALPPGPSLPRITQAWRYTFDLPRFFAESHAKFGSTWTMRLHGFPPVVITSDRDAVRSLLTGDPLTKRHGNDLLAPLFGSNSLLMLEPSEHLARRRLETAPFHGDRIRAYGDRIRTLFGNEVDSWQPDTEIEVHPRAQQVTLAVILELVLGVRDRALAQELGSTFEAMNTPASNLALFLPAFVISRSRWNLLSRPFWSLIGRIRELLARHIESTRADPDLAARADVLSLLICARDEDGHGLTDEELTDELVTLVAAGHETTATAIAWAAELLAHNPAVAGTLHERLAAGDREYLKATAKEVLRARTVAPVAASRHALEPISVAGYEIGPEEVLVIDAFSLHRDPELYEHPDQFRPERFLERQPEPYSYLPFGGGAHRCLGAALATLELELAIEAIVTRRELAAAGDPAGVTRRGVTLSPDNRGRIRVGRGLRAPVGDTPVGATTSS
jgi:cytochrome P450